MIDATSESLSLDSSSRLSGNRRTKLCVMTLSISMMALFRSWEMLAREKDPFANALCKEFLILAGSFSETNSTVSCPPCPWGPRQIMRSGCAKGGDGAPPVPYRQKCPKRSIDLQVSPNFVEYSGLESVLHRKDRAEK